MSHQTDPKSRLRIIFAKRGPLRYTSHLDLARIWERLLRRANLNVVYSQGFNPRPKIQLAAALPLGYTSICEVVDVWLVGDSPFALDALKAVLQENAPEGLEVLRVEQVEVRSPALQTLVREGVYHIEFMQPVVADQLREAVTALLAAGELPRERRGKPYDLRPFIHDLFVENGGDASRPRLVATLSLGETATGRPDELLEALGMDATQAHVERVALRFADDS